jgi:amino acid adenylation domain-containing protein
VHNTTTEIKGLLRSIIKQGIKLGVSQDKLLLEGNWQALGEDVKSLIRTNKQAIIDYVQARKEAKVSLIRTRPADAVPVLSFAQQRLWFIDQLDGGVSTQYNMPYALRLTGRVNRDALQRALNRIVARHEILRSVYYTRGNGEAGVRTMDAMPVSIAVVDLTHLDAVERDEQVLSLALAEAKQPFDLRRDLMLRASLVVLAEHEHVLLFTMHHIASDGWSLGVLTQEFVSLYDAYSNGRADPLPALQLQYGDFAYWQRNRLQGDILEQHLDFWLRQLADLPQVHGLPLDFPRPAVQSFEGSSHVHLLDKTLSDRLNALSLAQGTTLFMTLQTAFAVLLSRYSNETDIVMGMPIANRTQAELSPLIGFFVNTLVLRSDLSGNPPFSALLQKNKQMALEAYDHQDIPFELLVDKLRPERSARHGALYQIMFVVQNNEQDELRLPELTLSQVDTKHVVAKYDIHLGMEEFPDGLQATWTYCSALFTPDTIERMSKHLDTLLRSIVEAPDTPILNLPMLGNAERHQIAVAWNGKAAGNPRDCVVPQRFEDQVTLSPNAAAVRYGAAAVSYADLNRKANRLAHCLVEAGVEPGAVVGVHSARSPELLVALLAIWKCRAAYVPFDPNSTTKRLAVMIEDAGIELVVAQSALRAKVPVAGIDVLELDDVLAETWFAEYPDINPSSQGKEIGPDDSAYIIYTSGSTGVPKGVEIAHSNLSDYCSYALGRYYTNGLAGSLVVTSHAFDITVPSLYLPLLRGGCVELMPPQGELDALATRLASAKERYLLRMTPLHAQALLNLLPTATCLDTAHVFVIGGASFPPGLARELQLRFPNSQLFNHYGPTEATVGCAIFDVTAELDRLGKIVPIGSPMDNTVLYVLNAGQELVPIGVCGELYIGGQGLAKGYLNRPDLTAEKFIRNPFGDGQYERLYKSGDLVRWRPDGKLEYLGRCDDQVKIRGFRVELQEIEHQLRGDLRIAQAVVVALEGSDGEKRLVAYVVPAAASNHELLATQLMAALTQELPDYMVPSNIVMLEELPLSANGKVDKRRLPEPGFSPMRVTTPPETETERRLVTLWSGLLKVPCDDVTASFFELGGHSLLVTRLISAVNQAFAVSLKIADVFSHSTIRALAGLIDTATPGSTMHIPRLSRETPLSLSFAQQRLWLIDRLEGSSQYNMPFAFRLRGVLNREALQRTLDAIVARHEVLRSVYRTREDGEAFVVVQPACSVPVTEIDLMHLDAAVREERVQATAAADAARPFDLGNDLMLRATLLALAEQEHVLLFNMHHIASDGWSIGVLTTEFATLYGAFSKRSEHSLPALPVQYADFAHWQRHWLQGEVLTQQLDYWLNQLNGLPPVHGLPLDFPRSVVQRFSGALHSQRLDKTLSEHLQKLSLAHGTTLFMTLQTAFAVLLARYSSETDIVMGTPIANRTQAELSPLIGFFVNTLVLRSDLSGNPMFCDLLQRNKQMALGAYEHQHIPFEMLVDKLQPERSFHHSPLFQIMFTLQTGEQSALTLPGLSMEVLEQEQHTAKFDLTLAMHEGNDGLQMSWEYCTELFQATTVVNMAEAFVELLTGIVAEPNRPINSLPLVSARTRRLLLEEFARIPAEHPEAAFIHELFERRAETPAEAIADVRLYVLDQERQLLPIGAPGELYIAGTRLARSYSSPSELIAQRVVPNPFLDDPEVPLYRSGDQARWLPGGKLEYRGKIDSLVKIRGARIDLREIEVKLLACAGVSEAAVIAREIEPNDKQLIAYLSAMDGAQLSTAQLRQILATQVPEFMVPAAFVVLEALPRTPNGKVDRQALPTPDASAMEGRAYEAPQGEIETQLAALWQEVVSVPGVGRRDNFFALGGSSLSAVRLEFAIREHFGIELSFRELFEHPELAAQAKLIATKERLVELPAIGKVARDGQPLALSFAQQRLWLIDQLTPGGTQYNMPLALHLTGRLDVEALKNALDAIVSRHEVLRTVYAISDSGEPHQCIRELQSIPFSTTDLRDLPIASRARRMRELAEAEANKPFDLRQDSMLRVAVLVLGAEEHVLLLTMHHIASDGWSQNVLVEEFVTLYQALQDGKPAALPSLPVQYADFAHWQRGWLQGEVLDRQLNYWLRQLATLPQVHRVPTDFPRRAVQHFAGSVHYQQFDKSLSEQLRALSVAQSSTLFMTLQTAFATLLGRYSGETDIVMGTAIANRAQPELASSIGFFVNTLVLRSDLSGNPSFAALLQRNKLMALGAFEHQHIPFEMLVDELQPERSFSHGPLFQIMFTLQSSHDQSVLKLPGLSMQVLEAEQHTAKFDLTLALHDGAEGLRASWEYCTELFCAQTIANMADAFAQLLAAVVAEPECPIQRLPLLSASTREQLLALGHAHGANEPQELCIHQRFETQVQRAPEAIALIHGEQQLSYDDLNRRANRVAHHLIEQGVRPDTLIGVCVERSLDMAVSMLAVLKAGGTYVPLAPTYPAPYLAHVLEDAGIHIVLTQRALTARLPMSGQRLLLVDDSSVFSSCRDRNPVVANLGACNQAAVLYVSSSSGTAKGAILEHRSIVGLVNGPNYMELNPSTVFLQLSPIGFDTAMLEIWGSLLNGGRLVCYPEENFDSRLLAQQIQMHDVNCMLLTPSQFDAWSHQQEICPSLRWLLTGGDAVDPEAVARIYRKNPELTVLHFYGSPESTVIAACLAVPKDFSVDGRSSLGSLVEGSRAYVLSADEALQPPGAAGELYLGGRSLARGYRNQVKSTAKKFVADPFAGGADARMYRTGDQVRWSAEGRLEFIGHIDRQVNLDGIRIEPGEIEAALGAHAFVQQVVVMEMGEPKRLVAYVVAQPQCPLGSAALAAELHDHLARRLPKFMIPTHMEMLSAMPVNADGTLDRQALPALEAGGRSKPVYEAPQGEIETELSALWIDVLNVPCVGRRDNFFALGGSSLSAVRLAFAIQERFRIEVSIRELFENSGLATQASLIATKERLAVLPAVTAVVRDEQPLALSFAQQRLWFIDQLAPGSAQYNMPIALKLQGELHIDALHRAFSEIVQRHEVLRTVYVTSAKGEASQRILPLEALPLARFDLSGLSEEKQETEVLRLAETDAAQPFRLDRDLMVRVSLITLGAQTHVLLFNMHHIASDGWSMGVLFEEFVQLYAAFVQGQASALAPLAIQYADFAAWQRSHIAGDYLDAQMDYWQKQLAGIPPVHGLSLDRPRPLQPSFVGKAISMPLDPLLVQRLHELGQAHGATLFMVLHAAFAVLLGRWSREDDIVVGTPIAGRTRKELAPLIGFFVNNLVLRSRLNTEQSFAQFLRASRVSVLEAYEHQEVPFEMLVDRFCSERNFNHSPLFQILFSLQNQTQTDMALPGLHVSGLARAQSLAKFELSVQVGQGVDGHDVEWNYSTDVFDAETITSLAKHYVLLLQAVVAAPEQRLGRLALLTEDDQRLFAAQAARAAHVSAPVVCLHQLFEQQAARWPDNVALVHEGSRLSYRELNEQSNRLANYLRMSGVQTGDLVGLFVERSLDMVVSILGVLKAGAAYVPMDTYNPAARTQHMLDDAGVTWIISHRHLQSQLPTTTARVLHLDAPEHVHGIAQCSADDLLPATTAVTSEHAAYVIYTSGSTGKPKGVVVEHRHVVRLFDSCAEHFSFDHNDCWTLFHSYAFDFSVWEIWGALMYGARLVVVPYAISRSPPDFYQLLKEHRVTVLNQTPSAFYLLIEQVEQAADLDHLRYVVFGGEALDPPRLRPWLARFGDEQPRLINMYGITETTVHVTYRRIRAADVSLPSSVIGVPLRDLLCHVCNEAMSLQPIGVPGELFVGGAGVSRGYLNRPELNRERFIDSPFGGTAQRLYRTGDLARWTTAGELEYLGRIDHQAKLRGFRIELGEIEHELLNSDQIRECVVLLHGDRGSEQQLVAYVVPNVDDDHLPNLLREYLLAVLPPYMVPSTFIVLERIPLTENGKIDRRALLSMTEKRVARAGYVAPTTPLEMQLCEVWQHVLRLEKVGIHDNFFAVGGDSIRVVQIVKRAEAAGIALDVKDIFLHQTIAELARFHRQRGSRALVEPAPLYLLTRAFDPSPFMDETAEDCYPVTAMQQRMLEQHGTHGLEQAVYQPRVIYDIDGIVLDPARLEAALRYLLNKHPVLRTRFLRAESGDHVQVVLKRVDFRLPVIDISHLNAAAQEKAVAQLIAQDRPFALGETGIRFSLLVYGQRHHGLFISTHHAIIDGWALVELRNELMALYQELGQERPMPHSPSSGNVFKEHVALEREAQTLADHEQVWRELVADYQPMPALLSIAADASAGNALELHVDAALGSGLRRLAEQQRVTLKTLLLLAYQRALGHLLRVDTVTVDVVCSGRSSRLSDPLGAIGLFWSLLPVCTRLAKNHSDAEAIAGTAEKLLAMDAHSLFPADSVRKLVDAESMTYAAFNYVNFHNANVHDAMAGSRKSGEQEVGELKVRYASDRFAYAVKLAISGGDSDGGIDGGIEFDRRHFSAEQMLTLRTSFLAQLRQLVNAPAGKTHKKILVEEAHAEDVHE